MLKDYLAVALRNLGRDKGYAFINVVGPAVGLACFILILLFIEHELSYNRFHDNADRIHRIHRIVQRQPSLIGEESRRGNDERSPEAVLPGWLHVLKRDVANVLSEVPLMPLGVGGAVAAVAIELVFGLGKYRSTRFPRAFEVSVHVFDVDVEVLSRLAQPLRILVFGSRVSHHDYPVAEFHLRVVDDPFRLMETLAVLLEAKRFCKPVKGAGHVFVQ